MGLKIIEDDFIRSVQSNTAQKLTFQRLKFIIMAAAISLFCVASLNLGLTERSFAFFKQVYFNNQVEPFYIAAQENLNISIIMTSTNAIPQVHQSSLRVNSLDKSQEESIAYQFGKYFKIKSKATSQDIDRNSFETWIQQQVSISLENIKKNIADDNLNNLTTVFKNSGMVEGIVLASTSLQEPNYFYDWTRDSAITMNTIVNVLATQIKEEKAITDFEPLQFSTVDVELFGTILKYMNRTYQYQRTENLSGGPLDLGLGEPKWNVDGSAFMGSWGRPQNDGPALRANTMIHFLDILHQNEYTLEEIYGFLEPSLLNNATLLFDSEHDLFEKIIYYDLQFIVDNWQRESFDLWEELNGYHFFTSMMQLNSMRLGAEYLNHHLDWECPSGLSMTEFISSLNQTYSRILNFIENDAGFVDKYSNHIIENPQYKYRRSGLDISTLIASILTHDAVTDLSNSTVPFDYDSKLILNSLHGLCKSMQVLYPINHGLSSLNMGVSLGRYPEDVYNGNGESEGNPWFLATSSGAEFLYGYVNKHLKDKLDLEVDVSLDAFSESFWVNIFEFPSTSLKDVDANYNLVIPYGSKMYVDTLQTLMTYADSFLDQIRKHVSDQGNMSEQFNKYSGFLAGAKDLTWSYGTFWNTINLRKIANASFQELAM